MALRFMGVFGQRAVLRMNYGSHLASPITMKLSPIPLIQPIVRGNKMFADINPGKNNNFTMKAVKTHYSLAPLVVIIGGVVVAILSFWVYFWNTRPELKFYRGEGSQSLADTMDLVEPPHLKILKVAGGPNGNVELANLLKEINETEKAVEEKK
ncbi:uncharacterized protein LOC143917398 [Arctopsyche grandis]|uniref:uncharacterized protein LOC143917398 n=1 Tax=Arctopsyche grandis TaxID=121162 RepID=UPI00406D9EE1